MTRDFIDVPVFRVELDHFKMSLVQAVNDRAGELKKAIESGVELAYNQLPLLVAERCREATVDAIEKATFEALKEYFSPGGEGYDQVMDQVKNRLNQRQE
jgi:hypothetical protein